MQQERPSLEAYHGLLALGLLLVVQSLMSRRFSSEAPGTFEHTLMICGFAEEGARAIGAEYRLNPCGRSVP